MAGQFFLSCCACNLHEEDGQDAHPTRNLDSWSKLASKRSPQHVIERYREISVNIQELASEDMKEVVKAADYQRVDSLFVAKGHQQWGSFDPNNSTVQQHEQKQAGDEDLLDIAAIHSP